METITLLGNVLGGLGLFLLAISMMTDSLKLAAGHALKQLLSTWSSTPLRGIFSGFLMTAIVQSSSAVTVASLSFVNAGLLQARQALGIIYGTNIGTTLTGWLVALIGFKLNIEAFALPMIGLGMLIKLIKQRGKAAYFGLALVGFGLFFVGIDLLKNAFESLILAFDISQFTADGLSGIGTFLLIGIVMTILTQSSSASIALTITAASSGLLGFHAAAAMVIGANIGTTSTAVLAAIGATPNTKRLAAAQVLFNLATAVVALIILPILFFLIEGFTRLFVLSTDPAISLALFHTVFNILGVSLVYPYTDRLASFLERRFSTGEELASRPRFIDKTVAQTPELAVGALLLELQSLAGKITELFDHAIHADPQKLAELEAQAEAIGSLSSEISRFIVNIESASLGEETTTNLAIFLRIDQYFTTCTVSIAHIAHRLDTREALAAHPLETEAANYLQAVLAFMNDSLSHRFGSAELFSERFTELRLEHDRIKSMLILATTRGKITVAQMSQTVDCLAEVLHLAQQWHKGLSRLQQLQLELGVPKAEWSQTMA